jgi:hypothetical protein
MAAELAPGQIWESSYLLWLKGTTTISGINGHCDIGRSQRLSGPNTTYQGQTQTNCTTVDTGTLSDCREWTCRCTGWKGCKNFTNAH